MQTEKTKDSGTKRESQDFSFCKSKNFQKLFENMGQCFAGKDNVMDCSSMTDDMMKKMMDMFCSQRATDFKEKAKPPKDQGKTTGANEKSCSCCNYE
jgi:hypothetical protein